MIRYKLENVKNNNGVQALLLLGVALLVNLMMKLWKWDEPIETDIMMYCMGGHTFLSGKLLYVDLWDQKPPLIHFVYGIFEMVFGYGKNEVKAVNLVFSSILIIEFWYLAKKYTQEQKTRILLLTLIVVGILPNINYEINQPNCELLINGLMGLGLVIILLQPRNKITYILFGLLSLAASMIKQHSVLPMAALAFFSFFNDSKESLPSRLGFLIAFFSSIIVGWGLLFLNYEILGHLSDIWLALIASNASYNPDYVATLLKALSLKNSIFLIFALLGPLIQLSTKGNRAYKVIASASTALSLGCYAMVAIPGMWWPHYYQLMIIPIWLSALLLLQYFRESCHKNKGFTFIICLLIISLACYNIYYYLTLSALQISEKKYKGPWYKQTELVAPSILSILNENEWFFVWGQDPGLYVYTRKWPHTRFNTYFPFVFSKVQHRVYPIFFNDIVKDPPDAIVFPSPQVSMIGPNINDPILAWIASNYFPVMGGPDISNYLICCRLGSNLSQRIPKNVPRTSLQAIIKSSN